MNQKDLKKIAKQIAKLEKQLQSEGLSADEQKEIETKIETLCMKVTSFQDMDLLDEMIQENLKNS